MLSHSDWCFDYTADHGEVKLPSLGLGREDGQRLRAARCAACYAPPRRAMLATR